ncbi:hypothetical protein Ancab_009276 [Ancistrocladus abbreviatus]
MTNVTTATSDVGAGPHVAVFAFPFSTHAAPLLHITRRLATFTPTTLFSFFSTTQSNSSIFLGPQEGATNDHRSNNIRRCDVSDGVPEGYVFEGKPQEDIELFMTAALESLTMAVAVAEEETGRKISCIVSDAFLWFVVEMAEERAVPWVACWTSEEHSLSAHVYTDLIRQRIGIKAGAAARKEELLTFIPGMSRIRVCDLPDGIVLGNLESLFSKMLHQMGRVLPHATLVFANSFEELDPTVTNDLNSKLKRYIPIGPFNLLMQPEQPKDSSNYCLKWLDEQKPGSVAYISFGSVARPSQGEIVGLAEALEECGVKFLWSLRDNLKAYLPDGFAGKNKLNGMVLSWVPQIEVLEHEAVGVFFTHFGWNSLLESIMAEVPVIGRPFLGEQKLNGRLVEAVWEIGVQVEGGVITKEGVMKSLEIVLHGNTRKKMTEKIQGLRQLAEDAVGSKGSSTENFNCLLEIVSKN